MSEPKTCLTDGSPLTDDYTDLKENGQQKGYKVLCPEERAKGYIRPFRDSYVHVGSKPKYPLRDLTDDEKERYSDSEYDKLEVYPESESPKSGKFWTQKELDGGCGVKTKINYALAETYARDPAFYGGTYCAGCGTHFPVAEFVWEGTDELVGS